MPRLRLPTFKIYGIRIQIHLSIFLLFFFVGGSRFAPGAWLGITLLILLHELGHAALFKRYRLPISHISIHGLGGSCAAYGTPTPWQSSVIAWGGVAVQLVLVVLLSLYDTLLGLPGFPYADEFFYVLINVNALLIVLNLLPLPFLDGGEAWKLIPMWIRRRRKRTRLRREMAGYERELKRLRTSERARKAGFHVVDDDEHYLN